MVMPCSTLGLFVYRQRWCLEVRDGICLYTTSAKSTILSDVRHVIHFFLTLMYNLCQGSAMFTKN